MSWFASLLETNSPLLNNFEEFIKEIKDRFEDTDNAMITVNKIHTQSHQEDQPTSTYATNFCLIASDIHWDEPDLMKQFCSNLRSDVKDLLLSFPKDKKNTYRSY